MEILIRNQIEELELAQEKILENIKKIGLKIASGQADKKDYLKLNTHHTQLQEHKFAIFNLYQVNGKQIVDQKSES